MLKCFLFFLILLSMISSSFAAMSRREVTERFTEWMRCHNNTTDPSCPPCLDDSGEPLRELTAVMERTCLPDRREAQYVFSTTLDFDQRRARDSRICSCFKNGGAGVLESFSFEIGSDSNLTVSSFAADGESLNSLNRLTGIASGPTLSRLQRVSHRVLNERYLTVFSATSFTRTAADTASLGGRYSFTPPIEDAQPSSGGPGLFAGVAGSMHQFLGAVTTADKTPLDQAVMNSSNLPVSSCIPYRNFLSSRQFPNEPEFYSDLANSRSFNPADWNYSTLVDTFRRLQGNKGYEEFLREPEAQRLHRKMSFLHDNPVLKNIFQSQNTAQMERAYNLVKSMPVPCEEQGCRDSAAWIRSMQAYRQQMANLLADPAMIRAAEAGAARSRNMLLSLEALRTSEPLQSSDVMIGETASSDAGQWKNFCEARDRQGAVGIFDTLEEDFGIRNTINPQEDESYRLMNEVMCETSRRNPSTNRSMKFTEYFATVCPDETKPQRCSPENRAALVAEYIGIYSESPKGEDRAEVAAILPYIESELSFEPVTEEHTRNLNLIASNPEMQNESFTLSGSDPNYRSSLSQISQRGNTSQSTLAPETKVNPLQNGLQTPVDQVFMPQSRPAEITPETLQTAQAQLAEGESESREIRDEISSLRDVLRRSPASESTDSQAMTDLNQRLASLERRLQARERENSELREQIEEAQGSTRSQPERAGGQVAAGGGEGRRSAPVAAQAVAQGGSSSGAQIAGPIPSGGQATSASVAGRTSGGSVSRAVISSGNAALLSKYNVQSGSVQGSIIVADPSSAIDYQSLRTQSEGSVIPLTLTTEEYNLIASNDQSALNRYLAQVRAMPGNVVRLNITSAGQQLELFVLKNGNEISVIPANSPDRRPASVPSTARQFTLDNLRNELGN